MFFEKHHFSRKRSWPYYIDRLRSNQNSEIVLYWPHQLIKLNNRLSHSSVCIKHCIQHFFIKDYTCSYLFKLHLCLFKKKRLKNSIKLTAGFLSFLYRFEMFGRVPRLINLSIWLLEVVYFIDWKTCTLLVCTRLFNVSMREVCNLPWVIRMRFNQTFEFKTSQKYLKINIGKLNKYCSHAVSAEWQSYP